MTEWMRTLGRTGIVTSAVIAGGSPLGSMPQLYHYSVDADDAVEFVRVLLGSRIRGIDTSNGYSDGESERRIGAGIQAYGGLPSDFSVITKVDADGSDYSGERVRQSVRESKERLQVDTLPLVYLHDPEFHDFDDLAGKGGAVETLKELQEAGEVGHIGLAGGSVSSMSRYLDLGGFEVLLNHNRWTLVDRSAGPLFAKAAEAGIAVVNAAIYGGGVLTKPEQIPSNPGEMLYGYRPLSQATADAARAMSAICQREGFDLATAALQFSTRDPRIAATVVGMSKPGRIESTIAAVETPIPDEVWDELEALLPAEEYWLDRI